MLPSLKNRDVLIVSKIGFPANIPFSNISFQLLHAAVGHSDILVFRTPENDFAVKRCIATGGDYFRFTNKVIFLNNQILSEPYVTNVGDYTSELTIYAPRAFVPLEKEGRVPPGYVMLLGDNRKNSTDSRIFGLVPETNLVGRVILKF